MEPELVQSEIGASQEPADQGAAKGTAPPFEFDRLDRIAKSHLRVIELLHENFARDLASSLSGYLRTDASVRVVKLEQSSYSEFLADMSSPTCIVYVDLHPYEGKAVIELTSTLMFSLIELLLGGNGKTTVNMQRKITEIEKTLVQTLMRVVLSELSAAWKTVADIRFAVNSLASEPQMRDVLAPAEAQMVLTFEIRTGSNFGLMNLALPSIFIKRLRHKFEKLSQARKVASSTADRDRLSNLIQHATLTLEAHINGGSISPRRLLELEVGDVLVLEHSTDRKVSGLLNGCAKWLGSVVSREERLLFQVQEHAVGPRVFHRRTL
jgi:flagellar motor switch protein FliM